MRGCYNGARDAVKAQFEPKTACRNMPTRPCVILDAETPGVETTFPKRECLPHECRRFTDRYEQGQIPHQWAQDPEESDGLLYMEIGDYHGGPYCTRCKQAFCMHCDPQGLLFAVCEVQDETLF